MAGWGHEHHEHSPQQAALRLAMKMSTAVKQYLARPTTAHEDAMAETVKAFDREMGRVQ